MEQHIFGVTEVNELVKLLLDNEPMLQNICVRGELSNYKMYPSGHHYFSLKDQEGAIRCVMFKGSAMRLRFRPENGMKVVVTGRVTVFPRDGAYQLYCNTMTPEGVGDLAVAFEQLKAKLYAEGLFDPAHKKPLPAYPEKIAIVTSSAGAAVHDMIRILRRRYPIAKVILLPVRVQGVEAPPEIAGAIRYADKWKIGDVIITGRGGGSREDLWAFNEEVVARAIYVSNIPVISAVGHEPDVSISDYVADVRAATPSNGAELAVPDQMEERRRLKQLERRLAAAVQGKLTAGRKDLKRMADSRVLSSMKAPIEDRRMLVDSMERRMAVALNSRIKGAGAVLDSVKHRLPAAMTAQVKEGRAALAACAAGLEAMSPLKVLGRGYAIARTERGVVTSVQGVSEREPLDVMVSDGVIHCEIKGKEAKTWQ